MNLKKVTQKNSDGSSISYEFDVPKMQGIPDHPGSPKGTDTVPAWLTPGEFVMNAEAVREFGPEIEQMNNHGRAIQKAQGGTIPEYHNKGGDVSKGSCSKGCECDTKYLNEGGGVPTAVSDKDAKIEDYFNSLPLIPERPESLTNALGSVNPNLVPIEGYSNPTGSAMIDEFGVGSLPGEGGGVQEVEGTKDTGDLIHDITGGALSTQDRRTASQSEEQVPEIKDVPPTGNVPPTGEEVPDLDLDALQQEFNNANILKTSVDDMFPGEAEEEQNLIQYSAEDLLKSGQNEVETEEGKGFFSSVVDMFKKVGGELLDSEELTKQALMYLGSRAMGFSHGGSLRWSAGQYVKGLQGKANAKAAAEAAKQKRQQGLEDYEIKKQIDAKYKDKKTGKIDRANPIRSIGPDGKPTTLFEGEDANGNKVLVNPKGKPVDVTKYETDPYKVTGTKEHRQRINDYRNITAKQLLELEKRDGSMQGDKGTMYRTNIKPQTAAGEIAEWATQAGVPPEELAGLVQSAYTDAINFSGSSGTRASDIRPFLNQLVIRTSAGGSADLFKTGETTKDGKELYIDADKMANINSAIKARLEAKGSEKDIHDVANQYYTALVPEWNKLEDKQKKWNNLANKGENGFYVFLANRLGLDERNVK